MKLDHHTEEEEESLPHDEDVSPVGVALQLMPTYNNVFRGSMKTIRLYRDLSNVFRNNFKFSINQSINQIRQQIAILTKIY